MTSIASLPTNPNQPVNDGDLAIVNHLFQPSSGGSLMASFREPAIVGACVAVVLLPPVDDLIAKIIPSVKDNLLMKIIVKALLAMVLFFAITKWHLSRK